MTIQIQAYIEICVKKILTNKQIRGVPVIYGFSLKNKQLGAKTINIFRACLGAQLTICAQKWRNFVLFSTVSLRFVLSRVCVFSL